MREMIVIAIVKIIMVKNDHILAMFLFLYMKNIKIPIRAFMASAS